MYLIGKTEELTTDYLGRVIGIFQTKELVKLNKWRHYYEGKQDILKKRFSESSKPCNKVVVNYCNDIVNNYAGYITGKPVTYSGDNIDDVIDVLNYNDVNHEDQEYIKNALMYGIAFEVNYIDEEGKQRFRLFDSRQCIPVYDNTLNNDLLYVIRFYEEDLHNNLDIKYYAEVYGPQSVKTYLSTPGWTGFELISDIPHHFKQCPVNVFRLNDDEECIFNQIIGLQDAYNKLISGEVDDFESFSDAYLVLKGVVADSDDLDAMKTNKVLMVDTDASAEYLTKSISDTQIENMLANIDKKIVKISGAPDFTDEKFMAQSGIALKYKLVGFENKASSIADAMKKVLQRRIENIADVLSLTDSETIWRDVNIVFTRNLPIELTPSTPDDVMKYKGIVSDETLLGLLPFVKDVKDEMKKINEQKEQNIELYGFGNNATNIEEDDEESTKD